MVKTSKSLCPSSSITTFLINRFRQVAGPVERIWIIDTETSACSYRTAKSNVALDRWIHFLELVAQATVAVNKVDVLSMSSIGLAVLSHTKNLNADAVVPVYFL